MKTLDHINNKELKEFLSKGWITHDAMWYYNAVKECGIETGNKLNLNAIRMMSVFEVRRVTNILRTTDKPSSFDDLKNFMLGAYELLIPDFMKAALSFPEQNIIVFKWEDNECFAYKGVKQSGFIDGYQCGVMHRICCWYDALGVKYVMEPEIKGCLMHKQGNCSVTYRFFF